MEVAVARLVDGEGKEFLSLEKKKKAKKLAIGAHDTTQVKNKKTPCYITFDRNSSLPLPT